MPRRMNKGEGDYSSGPRYEAREHKRNPLESCVQVRLSGGEVGTGFLVDRIGDVGIILSAGHVTRKGYSMSPGEHAGDNAYRGRAEVHFVQGEKSYPAEIIGVARDSDPEIGEIDLTALAVKGIGPLPVLPIKDAHLGEAIHAYGALQDGLQSSQGNVIGVPERNDAYVATDMKVMPGFSGGPLLNANNEVVGLVAVMQQSDHTAFAVGPNALREFVASVRTIVEDKQRNPEAYSGPFVDEQGFLTEMDGEGGSVTRLPF